MKKLNKFSLLIILLIYLCSCKSEEEKRKEMINTESRKLFLLAISETKATDRMIKTDSLVTLYRMISKENADSGLVYAHKIQIYANVLQDSIKRVRDHKKTISDSIYKVNQVRIEKENAIVQKKWDNSKAGKIQKKHPYWSEEDCRNLAERRYWIGMSYEMLIYLRGRPNHVNPSNYGDGVNYQWCWDDHTPSCFYGGSDGIITSYN